MAKSVRARREAQKAAAQKAAATLRKRLAAEKKEAAAAGKQPPPTPAQKAAKTIRARKAGKEAARKESEKQFRENLGHRRHDAHNIGAEVSPPASEPLIPMEAMPAVTNLQQETTMLGKSMDTAMRTAFQKAGVDTARVELESKVRELLAKNKGRPEGIIVGFDTLILRRRDLREVLLLDYAAKIAGVGQGPLDAQGRHAASGDTVGQATVDAHESTADPAPGQADDDIQNPVAGGTYKRGHVHHVRTELQKAAAREAMARSLGIWSRKIIDRPIKELKWGELPELRRKCISRAGEHTRDGMYAAADAILLGKIMQYAQVEDPATPVPQVIPDTTLQRLNHEAAKEAPDVIDVSRKVFEGSLTKQIEHRV